VQTIGPDCGPSQRAARPPRTDRVVTRLHPRLLLSAYRQGIFPMADNDGRLGWYEPRVRAVIPIDERFHIPQRLARTIRSGRFRVTVDQAFAAVIAACAEPAAGRESTWISDEISRAYLELHQFGAAHSVETWQDGELVGGLYGVAVGGLFAGESMFHSVSDASKVALVALVERLRSGGFILLDSQFLASDHLRQFGTYEVPAEVYHFMLQGALDVRAVFPGGNN
jgi:leucyl/phenylalanyl-tRNA---protein transferase